MRKALVTVLLSAAALVGGTVAATAPAAANLAPPAPLDRQPAAEVETPDEDCLAADSARFDGRWAASDSARLHATLRGPAGAALCDDVALNVSVYLVPATWDGQGFNPTAVPQSLVEAGHAPDLVFPAGTVVGTKLTADVTDFLPECSNYQVDLYTGDKLDAVGTGGHGGAFITGGLVSGDLDAPECQESTPSTTTESTTPAETTTEPAETTTSTTESAETTTSTTESAETTTTASTTGATTDGTTTATTVAATTTAVPTTSTAPALAFTGSAGTGALVGLGAALLIGGVGITLLTASRRSRASHLG